MYAFDPETGPTGPGGTAYTTISAPSAVQYCGGFTVGTNQLFFGLKYGTSALIMSMQQSMIALHWTKEINTNLKIRGMHSIGDSYWSGWC